jgi:hypothetical protein
MIGYHAQYLEKVDRQREQAGRVMLAGACILAAGVIMFVVGNILIGAFHLTPRDTAWFWLFFPGFTVALMGLLASFFSMVVFLA